MNTKNEIVEPNDFLRKILNEEIGKDAQVFEFRRIYYQAHSEHCYIVGIKNQGAIFYSRTCATNRYKKNFQDIINKMLEDKKIFKEVMKSEDIEKLLEIAKLTMPLKYEEDKFFKKICTEKNNWWGLVFKEIENYIANEVQGNNIQRYTNCIENFKTYLEKKQNKAH